MEKHEVISGMRILNERSQNVGIIPGIGEGNAPIFFGKRVLVLRLVVKGKLDGLYVAAYWRLDNIKDISRKSYFSLEAPEQIPASIIH